MVENLRDDMNRAPGDGTGCDPAALPSGLELSRQYFCETAEPSLKAAFPELYPRLAAGLVGNGSECFGYDDTTSRDHDWGVDFYLWVTESDKDAIPELIAWKRNLLEKTPPGLSAHRSAYGMPPTVMTVGDFYRQLIGTPGRPETIRQWIAAPEENFAIATNGEVFYDGAGDFTRVRTELLEYFPEDLRRKRIASQCMAAAQTGQYNLERMAPRGEWVVLRQTVARFMEASMALVFLLNRRFRPYYKWTHRMLLELPVLGKEVGHDLTHLALISCLDEGAIKAMHNDIESVCALIIDELERQGLSDSDDWFLAAHGEAVQATIEDDFLRRLPAQYQI